MIGSTNDFVFSLQGKICERTAEIGVEMQKIISGSALAEAF
jgi:hypothetical protein